MSRGSATSPFGMQKEICDIDPSAASDAFNGHGRNGVWRKLIDTTGSAFFSVCASPGAMRVYSCRAI